MDGVFAQVKLRNPRGGASYHGEIYDYYRNDNLDANTFFNNTTGLPEPKCYSITQDSAEQGFRKSELRTKILDRNRGRENRSHP